MNHVALIAEGVFSKGETTTWLCFHFLLLWLFAFSCTAAGCIITQTGTIQSTLKRKASRSAAVKTAITAHQKHWRILPRLRMWCTQRWVWNKQFISKMVSCICKRFRFNITLFNSGVCFFSCCEGLLCAGKHHNGEQPGNNCWDFFWNCLLSGTSNILLDGNSLWLQTNESWTSEAGCRNQLVLFFLK